MDDEIGNQSAAQSQTGAASGYDSPKAMREKFWDECSADEKIKRLHDALVSMYRDNNALHETVAKLMQHQHHENGTLLQPLYPAGNILNEPAGYRRGMIPYSLRTERDAR